MCLTGGHTLLHLPSISLLIEWDYRKDRNTAVLNFQRCLIACSGVLICTCGECLELVGYQLSTCGSGSPALFTTDAVCVCYRDSREEALGEYYMRKYAKSSGGEQ